MHPGLIDNPNHLFELKCPSCMGIISACQWEIRSSDFHKEAGFFIQQTRTQSILPISWPITWVQLRNAYTSLEASLPRGCPCREAVSCWVPHPTCPSPRSSWAAPRCWKQTLSLSLLLRYTHDIFQIGTGLPGHSSSFLSQGKLSQVWEMPSGSGASLWRSPIPAPSLLYWENRNHLTFTLISPSLPLLPSGYYREHSMRAGTWVRSSAPRTGAGTSWALETDEWMNESDPLCFPDLSVLFIVHDLLEGRDEDPITLA